MSTGEIWLIIFRYVVIYLNMSPYDGVKYKEYGQIWPSIFIFGRTWASAVESGQV